MFYRLIIVNNDIEVGEKGIFESLEDAKIIKKLSSLELSSKEELKILEYNPQKIDNIPPQVFITVETFAENNENMYTEESRSWSIEKVSLDQTPINIPTDWDKKKKVWNNLTQTLPLGSAVIYQDDQYIPTSFTIIFPYQTKKLLTEDNSITKVDLIKTAKNIFNKLCEKKPKEPILIVENF